MDILILYSTTDGHTKAICHYVSQILTGKGYRVVMADLTAPPALTTQSAVLIGASIRYGRHRPEVAAFLRQHQHWLQQRPCGLFSVNLTARKPERADAARNPYLRRLLDDIGWRPDQVTAFAGKLDYPRCRWLDRQVIRLIMALTGGPTHPDTVRDYTDWQAVTAFALALAQRVPNTENGAASVTEAAP
ncbi:MAG: menaquinone-dependent protoporphyrinogen IX dehydrogenase [Paludibacterium sp.]|uniref:menaquinone-dependent protoporphyrinogen IX dehydrogenase n=1 Tax=Paludibacterium sp. TaxID=1917523 RepID=UPI0025CC2B82|nr:menaquinone-dependent protoporphyrinogen IX dehydrogenase [Paludibacterium sp.]MBV8046514.1 menaquinone-dependent protoporphyrinogen IX dehydrogenase [Paludibacterium sp.]MBV8648894.1 menaquinone-dependent protoporphyrinogen IX dehydrogenase [Paludibacterium sp.]